MEVAAQRKIANLEKRLNELEDDFRKLCLILAVHEIRLGGIEDKHESE